MDINLNESLSISLVKIFDHLELGPCRHNHTHIISLTIYRLTFEWNIFGISFGAKFKPINCTYCSFKLVHHQTPLVKPKHGISLIPITSQQS